MELKDIDNKVWEAICVLEMERRGNSPEYIKSSIDSGFIRVFSPVTKLTHQVVFKNTYYSEVLLNINLLDMYSSPYWIVVYLQDLGFKVF